MRSAGTDKDARIKVNEKLIDWSELIFVMEKRHKEILRDRFDQLLDDKQVIVLDISDDYQYMDDELINLLKLSVRPYVDL